MAIAEALKRRIERSGQTITLASAGDRGLYHDETPGDAATYKAIVQEVTVEELSTNLGGDTGENVQRNGSVVFLAGDVSVGMQDTLTMPNGDTPRIVNVSKSRDHKGNVALTLVEVV